MAKLNKIYKDNIGKGRNVVFVQMETLLAPYEKVIPIKSTYKTNLISWTIEYFKTVENSEGGRASKYLRTQLLCLQVTHYSNDVISN